MTNQRFHDTRPVYTGTHMECVSVQVTLCGCGIWALVEAAPQCDEIPARVHVSQADFDRAATIVEAITKLRESEPNG